MKERNNVRRASEAAAMATSLVEKSLAARQPQAAIACAKGCSYCCHSFVGIIAPEAFRLADAVRRRASSSDLSAALVQERCRPLHGLSPVERIGRKLACPLLQDGCCSVYSDRPMVCRQTTSLSVQACIDEFEDRNRQAHVPISQWHLAHAGNVHVAVLAALKAVNLPSSAYELSVALSRALSLPDAERRWLSGDNVFQDLPEVPQRSADTELVARRIADEIAG
jgi:Fe-S-cluster containining protein